MAMISFHLKSAFKQTPKSISAQRPQPTKNVKKLNLNYIYGPQTTLNLTQGSTATAQSHTLPLIQCANNKPIGFAVLMKQMGRESLGSLGHEPAKPCHTGTRTLSCKNIFGP